VAEVAADRQLVLLVLLVVVVEVVACLLASLTKWLVL
jgi:hypothetical protein